MIEFDGKTEKELRNLHQCITAEVLDALNMRGQADDQLEAVVSQMFGECVWEILTKREEQEKVVKRKVEDFMARQ